MQSDGSYDYFGDKGSTGQIASKLRGADWRIGVTCRYIFAYLLDEQIFQKKSTSAGPAGGETE